MNVAFREPDNEQELADLFTFRQSVYAQTDSLKSMVQKSDITFFDKHALHFAAYHENQAVGYMRMVQKKETKFSNWIKNSSPEKDNLNSEKIEFPFENYSPDKVWNKEFLSRFENQKIGEAGKLAIAKDVRSDQFLSKFIHAFLDHCIHQNGFQSGFGICTLELERFYKRLGFFRPDGAEPFTHSTLPLAVMVQFDANDLVRQNSKFR